MMDLIHKILYTGIGFAALTEQKAKDLVADLEKRGDISAEEGKKLAQELVEKARQQAADLRRTVGDEVKKIADIFKWVPRSEFDALKRRLDDLEARANPPAGDDSL